MRLETTKRGTVWVWYRTLDRRNGYLAWGPVGAPFDRSKLRHWAIAVLDLWRKGKR